MNDVEVQIDGAAEPSYPPGEYAIVELFGHTTLVGRIAEVERFGTKMLAIEPLFRGSMLPAVFYGGGSIYGLTPCDAATAYKRMPTNTYSLPVSLRAVVPPTMLVALESIEIETDTDRPEYFDHPDEVG